MEARAVLCSVARRRRRSPFHTFLAPFSQAGGGARGDDGDSNRAAEQKPLSKFALARMRERGEL